jgi:hypothetical protein
MPGATHRLVSLDKAAVTALALSDCAKSIAVPSLSGVDYQGCPWRPGVQNRCVRDGAIAFGLEPWTYATATRP